MTEELSKVYEPKDVEAQAEQIWRQGRYFHADATSQSPHGTYTIVIPPPNVTAALHLGHALNNTLQDILIRFRRMQGRNTLWMPGTDHAGIATQTVVEKQLLAELGKRRTDFGRDEFLAYVQSWKDEYEIRILAQLKSMGCSCDWDRTRFTMDEICARAVREAFFKLFADGLIYRGKRLVNWDPATQTVLADDEVEHQTVQGHFWYLDYPLETPVQIDGKTIEYITVATTRPETMLGDTAVAMNPADPRAKYLVGKMVRLPIVGRIIPVIADEHVVLSDAQSDDEKAKFSTGFLKVTPAHDPDDWQIGQRHSLAVINIMAPDGSISDKFGWTDWQQIKNPDVENLIGMDRFEAREAVVEWFRQENLLAEVRPYTHDIGHSYRSHVPIEPYLSDQWYIAVKQPITNLRFTIADCRFETEKHDGVTYIKGTNVPVNSLAGLALGPLLDERLKFYPERYSKNYQNWLENLRDWPISRQLWWGHRIPVWSSGKSPKDLDPQKACIKQFQNEQGDTVYYVCTAPDCPDIERSLLQQGFVQDQDVLDTWFSSALWPFSTLGWPEETPELKTFYPTDVLCTAREIITLWVSRMVMMGQYCLGQIPFADVYIHAMIQDGQGRKMSKSLGNGIDPLVAIDSHGADAMRFTLASMTTDTQDVRMPVCEITLPDGRVVNSSTKFDNGRNFCNKLWNASRFAMMNLAGTNPDDFRPRSLDVCDRWILSRLAGAIRETTDALENFRFNEPLNQLYRFFWNDLCDWYLEWAKPRLADPAQKPVVQNVLAFVLDQTLRLLHPFVPFITEGIFGNLNQIVPSRRLPGVADAPSAPALVVAAWPSPLDELIDPVAECDISLVQNVIRAVREIRNKYNIPPAKILDCSVQAPREQAAVLSKAKELIRSLAGIGVLEIAEDLKKPNSAAAAVVDDLRIYVRDVIDSDSERRRLLKQKQFLCDGVTPLRKKLDNQAFLANAKPDVIRQTRDKLKELADQLDAVEKLLAELEE